MQRSWDSIPFNLNFFRLYRAFQQYPNIKIQSSTDNALFATINQMLSTSSQLHFPLTELCSTIWFEYSTFGSSQKLKEPPDIFKLPVVTNAFVCWALNFRFPMLLKSAVIRQLLKLSSIMSSYLSPQFKYMIFHIFTCTLHYLLYMYG